MPITAQDCCNQIDESLEMFGRYSYYDQGPRETMNMAAIMAELNAMSAVEVRDLLIEVMKHPHGKVFVSHVIYQSQERPDEEFEILEQACPNW